MTEEVKESPVEVKLPEDPITEVDVSEKDVKVSEEKPKITPVGKGSDVDEREVALRNLKSQYEYQKQLAAAEREARMRAEQFAAQQVQNVQYAQTEVQDSNLRIIQNAIASTQAQAEQAERMYADAMAAGDYETAARAQRAIAQAETHLLQLENGKVRLEEVLSETTEGRVMSPQVPSFAPRVPRDPVDVYAERLTPKSAAWLRDHPEVVDRIPRLTRAHEDALEDGLAPESPEYFSYIEKRLGVGRQRSDSGRETRKNVVSAPVSSSGSVSSRSSNSSNSMILSSDEVEMAILAEPGLSREKAIEEYARNKAYLIKTGKMSA